MRLRTGLDCVEVVVVMRSCIVLVEIKMRIKKENSDHIVIWCGSFLPQIREQRVARSLVYQTQGLDDPSTERTSGGSLQASVVLKPTAPRDSYIQHQLSFPPHVSLGNGYIGFDDRILCIQTKYA